NVANEMDHESQSVGARLGGRVAIAKDAKLVSEGARNAGGCGRAIFRDIAFARAAGNIDEVPRSGIRPQAALVVGPRGGLNEWIGACLLAVAGEIPVDGACSENLESDRLRARIHVILCDQCDDLMSFTSPAPRGRNCS